MDTLDAVQGLLHEIGPDVGCRHRFEPGSELSFDLLARLGLLRSIDRTVPACVEHGCPLLGRCAWEADFAGKGARRSGRKFRVTDAGRAAAADRRLLTRLVVDTLDGQPPVDALGPEPRSIFSLASDLLEADVAAVDDRTKGAGMTRRELGAALRMLAAAGVVDFTADGLEVRRCTDGAGAALTDVR
ncbi:MAG TPA: hypothetical protein VMU89_01285 [Thermomicrobiaceae bacterium]|nr:hypothetical protein [Thermomicrobiaceae bacterium]